MPRVAKSIFGITCCVYIATMARAADPPQSPAVEGERLVLDERWSAGRIDPDRWYILRKQWGQGNHGVVPENVRIERDIVDGQEKHILVCEAHGDEYDGDVVGLWGRKQRVGGVIVSKQWFASGRFEIVMKIGADEPHEGGPDNPTKPLGAVPAIWTYGYRYVEVDKALMHEFVADQPLYNPHMPRYGIGTNEYWSEIDFPEFGKDGSFDKPMYNTFCQNRHDSRTFDVRGAADGQYHTYVTEWRTHLVPIAGVTDDQVIEHDGYFWIRDKAVPFEQYLGNPLKKRGDDDYLVYCGLRATHWVDGEKVGENKMFVPSMAAQLNVGVWMPNWAGPAPWATAKVRIASIKVWQYDDPGDVRGVLVDDLADNFDENGEPVKNPGADD